MANHLLSIDSIVSYGARVSPEVYGSDDGGFWQKHLAYPEIATIWLEFYLLLDIIAHPIRV